jgi:uncharacterized protein YoxC
MPPNKSENDILPPSELKDWIYRNLATVLRTVTIALSSIIWGQLVSTMEGMSKDIRELTAKINELVVNQATQRRTIKNNARNIRDLRETMSQHEQRWREQWQDNFQNQTEDE